MYCGDETGSFIGEVGSHSCRFGYGGEDNPKYVIPPYVSNKSNMVSSPLSSRVGHSQDVVESIMRMAFTNVTSNGDDDNNFYNPITNPNEFLRQGDMIENWDNLEVAWKTSMETLRVTDTMKHTKGGGPFSFKQQSNASAASTSVLTSASASKAPMKSNPSSPTSTTLTSITNSNNGSGSGEGKCVHPILAITPGITQFEGYGANYCDTVRRQQYTRYTETLMESMEASSLFLAPSPMLAAFSLGRQTALVVDVGAGGCRVTPVVDGLLLRHSQRRNGRGGDWLGQMALKALIEHQSITEREQQDSTFHKYYPKPRYLLRGRASSLSSSAATATMTSTPPKLMIKSNVFHQWAMKDLMYELLTEPFIQLDATTPSISEKKKSSSSTTLAQKQKQQQQQRRRVLFSTKKPPASSANITTGMPVVPDSPTSVSSASSSSSSSTDTPDEYQLPDGTTIDLRTPFGKDLRRIPELLFADQLPFTGGPGGTDVVNNYRPASNHRTCTDLPLHKLIRESLLSVGDVDARKELASCICLTGGASVTNDLDVRLSAEVSALLPTGGFCKPKIVASKSSSVERSYASWIGGSILTSLGSFQQLWLSRTEYEEYGTTMSIQRFP